MRLARYSFDSRMTLTVYRSGQKHELWGRTADIGEGGVAATISDALEIGEVASLRLSLGQKIVTVRAVVRFQRGHFCGFQFLTMTEEQRKLIASDCEQLRPTPIVKTITFKPSDG